MACASCKTADMVDVVGNLCTAHGKHMSFGLTGGRPVACAGCKTADMVNVVSNLCVKHGNRMRFGLPGKQPTACKDCKTEDMVNLVSKRCPNCIEWVDSRLGKAKYDGYCATCFKHTFPADPRSRVKYSRTKELVVRDFINENFPGFVHDQVLWLGGCDCTHKRRVDHRCLVEGTMLAVETDEFAHRSYDALDEEVRYDDLFMIHSGKWIFIRFNPDDNRGGKGVDMEDKLEALREMIELQIERIKDVLNTNLLEIHKMYY